MQAFIFGKEQLQQLADLKAHAEANVFSLADLKEIALGTQEPAGDREGFAIEIPIGFKVVFTHEWHPNFLARHLSVSVAGGNKAPAPEVIETLLKPLGYANFMEDCFIYPQGNVINIIEPIEPA